MPPRELRAGDSRRRPLEWLALAALLLLARAGASAWEQAHPPEAIVDRVSWMPIERAEAFARVSSRPILYDFTAEWCEPCAQMKRHVFAEERSARAINDLFVPVAVTDRTREMGRNVPVVDSLQRAFGVSAFPTLVMYMPATGEHMTQRGFPSAEETMQWLRDGGTTLRLHAIAPAAPAKP